MMLLQLFPKSSRMAASSSSSTSSSSENSNFESESDGLDSDSDYEIDEDQADEVANLSEACSEFSLAFFKVCIFTHLHCYVV